MLSKLAEYVGQVDRTIVRTPTKTTIVVPNDSILKLNNQLINGNGTLLGSPTSLNNQGSIDDYSSQLLSSVVSGADWPITDFLRHHMTVEKQKTQSNLNNER